MTDSRVAPLSLLLLAVLVAASGSARAEDATVRPHSVATVADALTGEAKKEYEAARALYAGGDYLGALAQTEAAYARSQEPRLLWDMAACEKKLRHFRRVIVLLRRLRTEGRAAIDAQDEERARALIENARRFTTDLTLVVGPPGAAVTLDGEELGDSPLAEVTPVDAGPHTLRVRKAGLRAAERTFTAAEGASLRLEVSLEPEEPSAPPFVASPPNPVAPRAVAAEPARPRVLPWAIAGAGAASLGVGVYFGVDAIERAKAGDHHGFSSAAWAADVCVGVGVVAVAAGLYFALRSPRAQPPSSGAALAPTLSLGGAGLVGTF